MTHNQIHQTINDPPPPPPTHTHTHNIHQSSSTCALLAIWRIVTAGTVCTDPDTVECVWLSGFGRWLKDVHMYYCYINSSFLLAQTIKPKNLKITSISLFPVDVSVLQHLKANGTSCGSQLHMYQPHYNRLMYGTSWMDTEICHSFASVSFSCLH